MTGENYTGNVLEGRVDWGNQWESFPRPQCESPDDTTDIGQFAGKDNKHGNS
jgi:hypothetical protein